MFSNLNDLVSESVFNAAVRYIDLSEPKVSLYIKLNWFLAYLESSFNIPVLSDFIRDEDGLKKRAEEYLNRKMSS